MYILSVTGHLELDVLIQQNSMNQGGWKKIEKIFFLCLTVFDRLKN